MVDMLWLRLGVLLELMLAMGTEVVMCGTGTEVVAGADPDPLLLSWPGTGVAIPSSRWFAASKDNESAN